MSDKPTPCKLHGQPLPCAVCDLSPLGGGPNRGFPAPDPTPGPGGLSESETRLLAAISAAEFWHDHAREATP